MARTPRTFSRGSHIEAKAGENIGQGKPREDVTEKAKETNQQEEIAEVSPTRSLSRFVGVLTLLPRLRRTRFRGCGLRDGRTWREGVLSLKHRRCNETNRISSRSAIPTRERLASRERESAWQNLRGRRAAHDYGYYTAKKPDALSHRLAFFFLSCLPARACARATFQIGREIHVFCRDVNRYVQTSFAAEVSAQFLPSGIHELAFSGHRHS